VTTRLLFASSQGPKAGRGAGDKRTLEALNRLIVLYQSWSKAPKAAEYRALLLNANEEGMR
jgi:hypothetical protein